MCTDCIRHTHRFHPFHRVEAWVHDTYQPAWLAQAGVRVHLGHGGSPCPCRIPDAGGTDSEGSGSDSETESNWEDSDLESNGGTFSEHAEPDEADGLGEAPSTAEAAQSEHARARIDIESAAYGTFPSGKQKDDILFVDRTGMHRLPVQRCVCKQDWPLSAQLMDMGFFPGSFHSPKTVFTFSLLDEIRLDSLECKTSMTRAFKKIVRKTSPSFPHTVPVSPCRIMHNQSLGLPRIESAERNDSGQT